jgi:geranylgeranyl diphosphate synthase, type II
MDARTRIERALNTALAGAEGPGCPPRLAAALRHAVFPTGALIRPRLCLAVAWACGEDDPTIAESAGAAIELLHCASLVHDDLPCFDDAATRRGRASVHSAFGEPLAVLAGDALIVLAFETLASINCPQPRMATLMRIVASSVGAPSGIVAGQAWESEPKADLAEYHRAKTGSLFAAATMAGAAAAGADPKPWRMIGEKLGEAYQVADDLRDAAGEDDELGKPVARDAALGRPSAALTFGITDAMQRLEMLVAGAIAAIPPCRGAAELEAIILSERKRLVPKRLALLAA